ncbi:nucleotidyltransferase family protein [Halanaerobium sp. Z-7514]|uniref:Nucleotidyltransferase family protein n=1 Tax=Halanaerobium polyolivorans TaxID=2886943 RepID=A0AAW4X139_9FIRM|nr:nucleotidyltransferase family protein [Halanaerobium polyolivorans]MCC3145521.1 nucleotidyltransferase family protein [Halanaerobium polyolivorans]RQD76961.1 MAG: nucleotidyltransferase family protein [Halanaerobium sp. MSAO_Bac5]
MLTAVVLAAGQAERMGELKQLLSWEDNNTILGKVIDNLLAADIIDDQLRVVIGAEKEKVHGYLNNKYQSKLISGKMNLINNNLYKKGLLTSVKIALKDLPEATEAILFTLADKPFINAQIYKEIYNEFLNKKPAILLPKYKEVKGHPVIIKSYLSQKIFSLEGRGGLRNLFQKMPEKVYSYNCRHPEILKDIDYKKDYSYYLDNDFKLKP